MSRRVLVGAAVFCHAQLYLRPSELLALRPEDVLLPVPGAARYRTVGVVVAPRELEATTKARSQDDTVLVDAQCQPLLADVLRELVRVRSGFDQLFPMTLNSYEKSIRDIGKEMALPVDFVPHVLRHSGPANDLYFQRRSVGGVAKRGRWASLKSVQRYGKSGRLLRVWRSIPQASRQSWSQDAPAVGARLLAALRRLPAGARA